MTLLDLADINYMINVGSLEAVVYKTFVNSSGTKNLLDSKTLCM